ncbi:hypothetical protein [Actinophytocola oryzae]|uniref:Uncharacterized protein n=1 Tax=Actinophytocola oryzae TaxID=502181 RepID=A0A4R7VBN2_9PSEU|nr:hypothetical protein [Actinophytocola oryzae]TDV46339.1 hypothetical protein CLV71_111298 [Actinophytocola oryzae]
MIARLDAASGQCEAGDALVGRVCATVTVPARTRDELSGPITGMTRSLTVSAETMAALASRLDGLREGLVEGRGEVHPEIGPPGQGHP